MNVPPPKVSLPGVTFAAVLAIILCLLGSLGCLGAAIGMALLPAIQSVPGAPPMPAAFRGATIAFLLFMLVLFAFGIVVAVAIFRRRNWARITMIIWGALMAGFCLLVVAFSLVLFNSDTGFPGAVPNADGLGANQLLWLTKLFLVIFYGIPALIGIWWVVLFTRPRVAAAFTNPAPAVPILDQSVFPQLPNPALVSQPRKPSCPLPLAILAVFFIFGGISVIPMLFVFPSDVPLFMFGHLFAGAAPRFMLFFFGVLSGAAGFGILKLQPWALYMEIGLQILGLLNCVGALFSPMYPQIMRAIMQKIYSENALLAGSPVMGDGYFRAIMIFSSVFAAVILTVLLWQRSRFLEEASAASSSKA
jgi:hypothetical protein